MLMLVDGDYVPQGNGLQSAKGDEAVLQRMLMKLTARRGSFPLWRISAADCGLWTGCVLRNGRLRRNSMYWRPSGMSRG